MAATTPQNTKLPTTVSSSTVGSSSGLNSLSTDLKAVLKNAEEGWTNLGQQVSASADKILNDFSLGNISDTIDKLVDKVSLTDTPPFTNVLHAYSSYNYIFTLSAIDAFRLNYPNETYKKKDLGQLILKSGSGRPNERVFINGIGFLDFYIDEVEIKSTMGFQQTTGNTNANAISFKIIEPYSMGMFFQALQTSARLMGFENYLLAPYLLTLEFIGNISPNNDGVPGDLLSPVEKTTRHFPLRFQLIDMEVDGAGSTYQVTGNTINQLAYSTTYTELKSDVSTSGKTVYEVLQTGAKSLQKVLNDRLIDEAKNNNKIPDQILISFPIDPSSGTSNQKGTSNQNSEKHATVDPNNTESPTAKVSVYDKLRVTKSDSGNGTYIQQLGDINPLGRASLSIDAFRHGDSPFPSDVAVYDSKHQVFTRGSITVDPNSVDIRFSQGGNVIDAINQVLLMSDYSRQALQKEQVTKTGKAIWWSIDTQVYLIPSEGNINITGTPPQLIVYRVIPFKVSTSTALPPGKGDSRFEEAKKQALREYNYIYTAQNLDIINFDIKFSVSSYQALNANVGQNSGDQSQIEQRSNLSQNPSKPIPPQQDQISRQLFDYDNLPDSLKGFIFPTKTDQTKTTGSNKGGGLNTNETLLAKQFHDILLQGKDMVSPNLEIWGDPYFITDSGMGNFSSKQVKELENINADHSINSQNGEIDIIINFRSPIDIDSSTGTYDFGNTKIIDQFSGLFQVTSCESIFSKGRFTQNLKLIRRFGQDY